jgi:hypothetical protein
VYPYLENIIESDIPFGILASGTKLRPGKLKSDLFSAHDEDIELLRRANEKAAFWGTREIATQSFLEKHGVESAQFTGDVAFLDEHYEGENFDVGEDINRIAISDPHYPRHYKKTFLSLVKK